MDQGTESSSITFYDEGIRRDSLAVESVEGQEAPPPSLRVVAASTRIVNYWAAYDDSDHEQAQKEAFKYLSHVIVRYNAHLFLARTGKTCKRGGDVPKIKQEDVDALFTSSQLQARAVDDMRKELKKAEAELAAADKKKAEAEAKAGKVLHDQKKKVEKARKDAKEARSEAEKIAFANQELKDKLKTLQELDSQFSADDLAQLRVMLAQQDGKEVKSAEEELRAKMESEAEALKKRIGKLERELKQKDERAKRMSSSLEEEASQRSRATSRASSEQVSKATAQKEKELAASKKETEELRTQLKHTQDMLIEAQQIGFGTTAAAATMPVSGGGSPISSPTAADGSDPVGARTAAVPMSDAVASVDPEQFAMITKKLNQINVIKESIGAMERKINKSIDKLTERFDGPFQEHYKPGFTGVMGEDPEMKAAMDEMKNTIREKERKLEDAHNKAAQKERECAELEKQLKEHEFGMSGGGGGGGGGGASPTKVIYKTKDITIPTSAGELFDLVKVARDDWVNFERLVNEFRLKIEMVRSTSAAAASDETNGLAENSAGFAKLLDDGEAAFQELTRHQERVAEQLATFNGNLPRLAKGAMDELGSADVLSKESSNTFRLVMEVVHALKTARGPAVPKHSEALVSALGTSVTSLIRSMDMMEELPKIEGLIASIDRDLNTMTCALLHKVLQNQNKVRPTPVVTQEQVDSIVDRKLDRLIATSDNNNRPKLDYSAPLQLVHSNGGFLLLKQDEDFDSIGEIGRRNLGPIRGGRAATLRAASRRDERDEDFLLDDEDEDEEGMLPSSNDDPTSGYDRLVADLKKINEQKLEAEIELQAYHRQVYGSNDPPRPSPKKKKSRFPKIRSSGSSPSSPGSGSAYAVL